MRTGMTPAAKAISDKYPIRSELFSMLDATHVAQLINHELWETEKKMFLQLARDLGSDTAYRGDKHICAY
jgi:hypothetical protein